MSIALTEIKDRLRPFLLAHVDGAVLAMFNDSDFVDIFNDTANDFNDMAMINLERYNKETGSTTAESTDTTYRNYLMQGAISKILYFKYDSESWNTQRYTYTDDRIALKVAPDSGVEMDIRYLRKCEDMTDATDDVDLPDNVLPEYIQLLKARILADYSQNSNIDYEGALLFWSEKAGRKIQRHVVDDLGTFRHWFYQNDDGLYDITDSWISLDNFVANASGDLIYTE